jgi:DNA-binding transcriptional LysR family regulator
MLDLNGDGIVDAHEQLTCVLLNRTAPRQHNVSITEHRDSVAHHWSSITQHWNSSTQHWNSSTQHPTARRSTGTASHNIHCRHTKKVINEKLQHYGVEVFSITISQVSLPHQFR